MAIEKLLEVHPNCICILIDDTSEFLGINDKVKGIDVYLAPGYELSLYNYQEYIANKLDDCNFFRISYSYHEYEFKDVENSFEEFSNKLREIYNRMVFIIYKSAK